MGIGMIPERISLSHRWARLGSWFRHLDRRVPAAVADRWLLAPLGHPHWKGIAVQSIAQIRDIAGFRQTNGSSWGEMSDVDRCFPPVRQPDVSVLWVGFKKLHLVDQWIILLSHMSFHQDDFS